MPVYRGLDLLVGSTDSEHRGYYEAAGRGQLVVQRCTECSMLRGSIGAGCPFCGSGVWSWLQVSGRGTIYSYQIVVHPVQPAFRDWAPYPLVLVELDEQRALPWRQGVEEESVSIRITANLVKPDDPMTPESEDLVNIGAAVEVCFVDLGDGLALPQFRLAGGS